MATLITEDYRFIKHYYLKDPAALAVIQALQLSKTNLMAVFQAIETYMTNAAVNTPTESLQDAMETAAGVSITVAQMKEFFYAWAKWREWKRQ